jgi:outer membrane protein TolC
MLPRVSLSALLGLEAHDVADLARERASFGALGADLVAPVFQGGRLSEERCAAIARWEAAVAGYRKAVQGALRDVSDQLIAIRKFTEARVELEKVVASLDEALGLASTRYDNGASAYFEVLDAQRRLFAAQLLLTSARRDEHVAFVRLYRALGGGWDASSSGSGPAPVAATPGAPAGTGP